MKVENLIEILSKMPQDAIMGGITGDGVVTGFFTESEIELISVVENESGDLVKASKETPQKYVVLPN